MALSEHQSILANRPSPQCLDKPAQSSVHATLPTALPPGACIETLTSAQALERYPLAAEPGSPLPASLSPGPKSHRIHITASPSHHSYAPEAARKSLDGDGAARGGAAHGYVPSSGGPPAVTTAGQPRGHAYFPPAPEGAPTANGASAAAVRASFMVPMKEEVSLKELNVRNTISGFEIGGNGEHVLEMWVLDSC